MKKYFARLCLAFLIYRKYNKCERWVYYDRESFNYKIKRICTSVIKVCKELRNAKCESALINQFLRSGTSIGANIREAFYAHGKADFVAKLQIALKECSESEYWIELLIESGYYNDKELLNKCVEIKRILIASINTAKENE